jgi:5-methylcytosine-specific restriction endonuclease McrA
MSRISKDERRIVLLKYKGKCAYCGCNVSLNGGGNTFKMHVDHIIPRAHGGRNNVRNYNPSCKPCNALKRDYSIEEFKALIIKGEQ